MKQHLLKVIIFIILRWLKNLETSKREEELRGIRNYLITIMIGNSNINLLYWYLSNLNQILIEYMTGFTSLYEYSIITQN